jgi:hypothetical protein
MLKLTSAAEVNRFFSRWHELTESERLQTIRELKNSGKLSIVPRRVSTDTDFQCPLKQFIVARPCNMTTCQYYIGPKRHTSESKKRSPKAEILEAQQIAAAECKNCLILCLDKSKNGRLSAQEVATVMGISVSEVNSINNNTIAKIRRAKIKEQIERLQLPRFKYLKGFCVSCGMNIEDELELNSPEFSIVLNEHGWCSEGCRDDKPKWQFYIERSFNYDYLDVLAVGLAAHQNIDTLGNVFGVSNDEIRLHSKDIKKRHAEHKLL